ncbi:hypothetical protein LOTGIDRAFT_160821 [Lottia gigantea]|uniref:Uncharacterized protein n=1 Tax=Lottia gigantea TaxID=225164 RepID=V4C0T1_LOTGI|nr:hypothetical protein LOTGIDRAFT_160821 [Lottia gigantea]ESO95059.1 hypothetical protein LOTGIDRAFT_160821 [Lottia gigantea]
MVSSITQVKNRNMEKIQPPQPMSFSGNIAENWRKWEQRYRIYMKAAELSEKDNDVQKKINPRQLPRTTNTVLHAFGNSKIRPIGKTEVKCTIGSTVKNLQFYVTDRADTAILGHRACEKFNLIQGLEVNVLNRHDLIEEYQDVFKGSREAESLKAGDVVCIRNNKTWEPGVISRKSVYPRSYYVQYDGQELRRNQRHLLKTKEPYPIFIHDYPEPNTQLPQNCIDERVLPPPILTPEPKPQMSSPNTSSVAKRVLSRKRVKRRPTKYDDYV